MSYGRFPTANAPIFNVPPPPLGRSLHPVMSEHFTLSTCPTAAITPSVAALLKAHQSQAKAPAAAENLVASTTSTPVVNGGPCVHGTATAAMGTPKSGHHLVKTKPPFHEVASMPLLDKERPLVPFYATPPRLGPQFLLLPRSSSSVAMGVGGHQFARSAVQVGKNGRYTTPPPLRYPCGVVHKANSDDDELSTLFAASKFSDSPSAKSLPPPPSQWLIELEKEVKVAAGKKRTTSEASSKEGRKTRSMDGIREEDPTSDDTGVVFDLDDSPSSGSLDNMDKGPTTPHTAPAGVRVDPMKLIAAAASP